MRSLRGILNSYSLRRSRKTCLYWISRKAKMRFWRIRRPHSCLRKIARSYRGRSRPTEMARIVKTRIFVGFASLSNKMMRTPSSRLASVLELSNLFILTAWGPGSQGKKTLRPILLSQATAGRHSTVSYVRVSTRTKLLSESALTQFWKSWSLRITTWFLNQFRCWTITKLVLTIISLRLFMCWIWTRRTQSRLEEAMITISELRIFRSPDAMPSSRRIARVTLCWRTISLSLGLLFR